MPVVLKRTLDVVASAFYLILLSPIFLIIAFWIKRDSAGEVFFRQTRVGKCGKLFKIYKFRSMRKDSDKDGRQVTTGDDNRITNSGKFIRKYKLDELPQLINVFLGDMSLVGPRPEVPKYVEYYPSNLKRIALSVKPGITDIASIKYRDESRLLSSASDPEGTYIDVILPAKLEYVAEYVRKRSFLGDVCLIFKTIYLVVKRK